MNAAFETDRIFSNLFLGDKLYFVYKCMNCCGTIYKQPYIILLSRHLKGKCKHIFHLIIVMLLLLLFSVKLLVLTSLL